MVGVAYFLWQKGCGMVVKARLSKIPLICFLRNPSDAAAEAGKWEGVEGFQEYHFLS